MGINHSKKIFEELDKDRTGDLNLEEILNAHNNSDLLDFDIRTISLITVYWFDASQGGTLTQKEFAELAKFVKGVEKKVKNRQKKRVSPTNFWRTEPDGTDLNSSRASFDLPNTGGDAVTLMYTSSTSIDTYDDAAEVRKQINLELLPSINKHLMNKSGRQHFLHWLFKVADLEQNNRISYHELHVMLSAVQKDGIDLSSLLFDEGGERTELTESIMREYDIGKTGYLTKEEFLFLGEIIISQYIAKLQHSAAYERVGDWELTHILGEGSYGVVKYGVNTKTGERAAIKVIKRGNVSDMSKLDIEIQAMKMLDHPNIVKLEDVIDSKEFIYLVMELCGGGSLSDHITDKPFAEELACYYFNQLIDAISYCHSQGVCHRDLRLDNLLLDNNGNLKVTDFGQARIFAKGWDLFSTHLVGALNHLSPEQINGQCYSGEKVDIWCTGIILYYFLTAVNPFSSLDISEMFDNIKNGRYAEPENLSESAKDLIAKILQVDPEKRLSLEEIKQHPWTCGTQKLPVLMQYKIALDCQSVAEWMATGWPKVEAILASYDIFYKKSESNTGSTLDILKCIFPAGQLKFTVSLMAPEGQNADKLCIQFTLREGESKEFRKLLDKVFPRFQKEFKKNNCQNVDD